jgi:DNA-binding MarR family transcriptional regulator
MADEIKLIRELLDYVEIFKKERKKTDIATFTHFLSERVLNQNEIPERHLNDEDYHKDNYENYKRYAEIEFSTLLTNLYRFARHYIKKAMKNTEIKTVDEFGFLATLLRKKRMQKKELINLHILETSSGSEILKRLNAKGLIKESPDQSDKRAKLVSLTPKGVEVIMSSFDQMHTVSEIVIGNLTEEEIKQSLRIFNKLSNFHKNIDRNDKSSDLQTIHHKYIAKDEA